MADADSSSPCEQAEELSRSGTLLPCEDHHAKVPTRRELDTARILGTSWSITKEQHGSVAAFGQSKDSRRKIVGELDGLSSQAHCGNGS